MSPSEAAVGGAIGISIEILGTSLRSSRYALRSGHGNEASVKPTQNRQLGAGAQNHEVVLLARVIAG